MDDIRYWVWLSTVFSYGSDKPDEILRRFESPKEFFSMSAEDMSKLGFLSDKDIKQIKGVSIARADKIIKDCERLSIDIVPMNDERYPNRLKLIYGPPVVLYVKGDISGIDDEVVITVVGTRNATDYSAYTTEYLSYQIASANGIIVSGCAVGIDACAHRGALKAKGRTIAVLGCGLDVDYPQENRDLKEEILRNGGALISELPPKTAAAPWVFPIRNRIMAGLALGVLVTHAPERSGSLITVEHAIEQGKDVFCVPPYSIFDSKFFGVIKYLRDGAIPVFSDEDILREYFATHSHKLDVSKVKGDIIAKKQTIGKQEKIKEQRLPEREEPKAPQKKAREIPTESEEETRKKIEEENKDYIISFDDRKKTVYNKLTSAPKHIDELCLETGLTAGVLSSILTEFEIMGVALSSGGKRYSLNV